MINTIKEALEELFKDKEDFSDTKNPSVISSNINGKVNSDIIINNIYRIQSFDLYDIYNLNLTIINTDTSSNNYKVVYNLEIDLEVCYLDPHNINYWNIKYRNITKTFNTSYVFQATKNIPSNKFVSEYTSYERMFSEDEDKTETYNMERSLSGRESKVYRSIYKLIESKLDDPAYFREVHEICTLDEIISIRIDSGYILQMINVAAHYSKPNRASVKIKVNINNTIYYLIFLIDFDKKNIRLLSAYQDNQLQTCYIDSILYDISENERKLENKDYDIDKILNIEFNKENKSVNKEDESKNIDDTEDEEVEELSDADRLDILESKVEELTNTLKEFETILESLRKSIYY